MENNPRQYFGPKDIEMIGRILDKNGMIDGKSPFNDARLASAKSLIKAFQKGCPVASKWFASAVAPPA